MVFAVVWNTRRTIDNRFFLYVGLAYLFVGLLTILHMLSYKGMPVFPGFGANLPTQLWIATRLTQSIALLAAALLIRRESHPAAFMGVCGAGFVAVLLTIFQWRIFPQCYIEGVGLTHFKIVSEYVICVMLLATIFVLLRQRERFDPGVFRLLVVALAVSILSEICFTEYVGIYDFFNMLGHYIKLVDMYLIYVAIVETSFYAPLSVLFRNLKQNEEVLSRELTLRGQLERRQNQLIGELRESLHNVKTLRGLLPICAHCKKIRDDKGYWNQVETYIRKHADVDFSHGICPECLERYYPEFNRGSD